MTFAIALLLALGSGARAQGQKRTVPPPTFEDLLKKVSSAPADACQAWGEDFSDLEFHLFEEADKAVTQSLTEASGSLAGTIGESGARASEALQNLEHLSANINKSWPDEKRFHFRVLEVPPVLLVKMTFRNRATFSVFADPQLDPYLKPAKTWRAIGVEDNHRYKPVGGYDWLELFPLDRGPAKRARFLVKFGSAGCGSGVGAAYYAYEWNPQDTGDLSEFIKLEGAVSQEEPAENRKPTQIKRLDSFRPIGKLQTQGSLITLPYCWFSAIDTWNNPSLCAADAYDLSGNRVRFISTVVNRPDLLPIAKAIQYAQAHDYPAVLAYCGSPDVARQMMSDIPPSVYAGAEIAVKRIGTLKERIEMEDTGFHFEVEKRGGHWLVVSFRMD